MAESIKQVFDIRPGKGMSDGQSNEHQRNWTERGWEWATRHGNYDRTRERLNLLKYKTLSLSATCVYVLQISCKPENKHP